MKIIFLDIDGVMKRFSGEFLPQAVEALNWLLKQGVGIVISSSWRENFTPGELRKFFAAQGVHVDKALLWDYTPILVEPAGLLFTAQPRCEEIRAWLAANECGGYAVIDDLPDAGFDQRFVLTDSDDCLNPELAKLAWRFICLPL